MTARMDMNPVDASVRRDGGRGAPAAPDPRDDRPVRFADLLAAGQQSAKPADVRSDLGLGVGDSAASSPPAGVAVSSSVAVDRVAARSVAEARVFNQFGFFGPGPIAAVDAVTGPVAIEADRPSAVAVSSDAVAGPASTQPASGDSRPVASAALRVAAHPAQAPSIVPQRLRDPRSPSLLPRAAAVPQGGANDVPVAAERADGSASAAPTRPVVKGASVAVAVQAGAGGVDVAAQVAGLDERDRARLADEVAAMLSMHGYAPAQVTVTAVAPRAARQEYR